MRLLLVITAWLFTGVATAAPISYLTQDRSVSVNTLSCPGLGGAASAADFGAFDATVASPPSNVLPVFCEDVVRASQNSALNPESISIELAAFSGTSNLVGGGPALSDFDVTFSLTESTWLQFSGSRFVQTELGPNVVASENSAIFESLTGGALGLSWVSSGCDDLGNGSRCEETLDALIQLGPGDYRLALTSLSHVDGTLIEFGAYREVGTQLLVTTAVPIPAAVWLFGSAMVGLGFFRKT